MENKFTVYSLSIAALFAFQLNLSAKSCFDIYVEPGHTILPNVAYVTPGQPLHLVIEFNTAIFDGCIPIDTFTIYRDNNFFEQFSFPYNSGGWYDVYLYEPGVYTGYLYYLAGNFTQLYFTLNYVDTTQTTVEAVTTLSDQFSVYSENGNDFIRYTSVMPSTFRMNLYNVLGELTWTQLSTLASNYLINVSDLGLDKGIYIFEAYVNDRRFSFKLLVK